ncbi:MAG: hypothetical protein ACPG5B_07015 [Chitinophagales bacterium]
MAQNTMAQQLIYENFNNCELPADWNVNIIGNQNGFWDVSTSDNPDIWSNTIDGSCPFYFDDDMLNVAGDFEAWQGELVSPSFDATTDNSEEIVLLEVDVHFAPGDGSTFTISVFDGSMYQDVAVFDNNNYTGWGFVQHERLAIDVTAYANSNMNVKFTYDDNASNWALWAAVDDFEVSKNIMVETFNDCTLPAGWTNEIVSGDYGWQFGNDTIWTTTMNGTCMAFFNDNNLGENATPSEIILATPSFDATQYGNIVLNADIHFASYENVPLVISVYDGSSWIPVQTYMNDIFSGWSYREDVRLDVDLSAYRNPNMRISFTFDDLGIQAWQASIENVKIQGYGVLSDVCEKAIPLTVNAACETYTNENAIFSGPAISCADSTKSSIWFAFDAPSSGNVSIKTSDNTFNEIITLFSGSCGSLTELACINKDEFGFIGETLRYSGLTPNNTYFARVSGNADSFGAVEGETCIQILDNAPVNPAPINDNCADAVMLSMNDNCVVGANIDATFETNEPFPLLNNKSRASVWYAFVAPNEGELEIFTDADFADVITVFSGSCSNLTEVDGNDMGQSLKLKDLNVGETYLVQITGFFATIEGNICMSLQPILAAPNNDICTQAINLIVNEECQIANNEWANFGGNATTVEMPFSTYKSTTEAKTTYLRPNGESNCTLSDQEPNYDAIAIRVETTGTYTIHNQYFSHFGYLHLYENNFDPTDPCLTYMAGNVYFEEDFLQSQITTTLTAGTTYYLVTSGWGFYDKGKFTMTVSGAGTVNRYIEEAEVHGNLTSCSFEPSAAVWFQFDAPASGAVNIHSGADFVHVVSVFEGICGDLREVTCFDNPSKCDDGVSITGLTPNETYFVQIASTANGFEHNYGDMCVRVRDEQITPVKVKIRMFLEGAYLGNNTMTTALKDNNLVPYDQPYGFSPWNYQGKECINTIPNNVVDWVLVELRDATDNTMVIERKAALLLSTGSVVDEGRDGVMFNNANENESYHIVVRHRNHLDIISSVPVPVPNMNHYLFNDTPTYTLGGENQVADLGDGNYGLKAGDMDRNGVITVADFNIFVANISGINVYSDADCTLDRNITVADFNAFQPNASAIGVSQVRY